MMTVLLIVTIYRWVLIQARSSIMNYSLRSIITWQ